MKSEVRKKQKALVTGGSRGIGLAIVKKLLEQGCDTWYLSRNEAAESRQLINLARERDANVHWIGCDLSNVVEFERALEEVSQEAGQIDYLVNNVGMTRDGLLMRMSDESWQKVMNLNVGTLFYSCRKFSRLMAKQRSGSIVNISSVVALTGNAGQTNYAASKAAVIGFSKSLAREVAQRGVRVNVVAPGFIETNMTDLLSAVQRTAIIEKTPLSRMGQAQEVAEAVWFLCSPAASYITGTVLTVDGGLSM